MRDVDVYCRSLESAPADRLGVLLSEDERLRAGRFHFDRHRTAFIAARGMLRVILGEHLGVDPQTVEFTCNVHGKPALKIGSLHFNVSHSADMAVYAVSRTREVGIDIERINPRFAHDQIPERFFSRAEVNALRALPDSLQTEAFFQIWTRKEAYVKARGLGLSLSLESFDVSLGEPAKFLRGVEGWSIESIDPAPGYAAALVAREI